MKCRFEDVDTNYCRAGNKIVLAKRMPTDRPLRIVNVGGSVAEPRRCFLHLPQQLVAWCRSVVGCVRSTLSRVSCKQSQSRDVTCRRQCFVLSGIHGSRLTHHILTYPTPPLALNSPFKSPVQPASAVGCVHGSAARRLSGTQQCNPTQ